jgi:Protein of unknown function (DUF742)
MSAHEADDERTGRRAGGGLGAQAPPPDDVGPTPDEPVFVTEYVDSGFGSMVSVGEPKVEPRPRIDELVGEAALVRPYAWTRGRTRANYDLKLETLVSATELAADDGRLRQLEHREVSALCRYPLSVAEVAAKLSIPLGVARVILSDMAELGLISIHRTFADDDIAAHLVLMERVLSGLRRL